ncbi:hypothetical protein [Lactococcus petauri]|uniref:hypothetical protein n=1 Tax=Lactococcus petauri TaxID=1940789 RepID=UPI00254FDC26|nr:hypothetical protein [Lactococcus petauri]
MKKKKRKIKYLKKRIEHFQFVHDILNANNKKYYLEKEWLDNVELISKKAALQEVEKCQKELDSLTSASYLKLLHLLRHQ